MLISKSKIKNIIKKLILEAYIDSQGDLGNFNAFPYNIKTSDDTSPLYNPSLPKRNRFKAPDGGAYLELIVTDPYQKDVLERVLKIAVDKGRNMPDLGGKQNLRGFKFKKMGNALKVEFSTKHQELILKVLEEVRRDDLLILKDMHNRYDKNEYEKEEELEIFNNVFKSLINSIR